MGYNLHFRMNPDGSLKLDLRERTIQRIKTEGLFHMGYWSQGGWENARLHNNVCATACCLAGNIVHAAKDLELIDYDPQAVDDMADAARRLWARYYGWSEACRLDFWGESFKARSLDDVTPDQVIEHLDEVRNRT